MQRLFAKEPSLRQSLKEKFNSEQHSRDEFINRSRGLLGSELKAVVVTMVSEKTTEVKLATRKRKTEYLDSVDLKKRFADKPDECAKLMAAGYTFLHPDTGAELYALTTFALEHPPSSFCYVRSVTAVLPSSDVQSAPMDPHPPIDVQPAPHA